MKATPEDALEVAGVHVRAWQSAYRGLLPDEHLDGLRVDWPGRWFHVRVSQTEPIVRVICEQRGDPPKELFEALLEEVRSFA